MKKTVICVSMLLGLNAMADKPVERIDVADIASKASKNQDLKRSNTGKLIGKPIFVQRSKTAASIVKPTQDATANANVTSESKNVAKDNDASKTNSSDQTIEKKKNKKKKQPRISLPTEGQMEDKRIERQNRRTTELMPVDLSELFDGDEQGQSGVGTKYNANDKSYIEGTTTLESQKIMEDVKSEDEAYKKLMDAYEVFNVNYSEGFYDYNNSENIRFDIQLQAGALMQLKSQIDRALDDVYNTDLSIDDRLERIQDVRMWINDYKVRIDDLIYFINKLNTNNQAAIDRIVKLFKQVQDPGDAYIKILKAKQGAIGPSILLSLKNEENSLITEKRKAETPYEKEKKNPKLKLDEDKIIDLYKGFSALQSALNNTNVDSTRIKELADTAFAKAEEDKDNRGTFVNEVFDNSKYDLSGYKNSEGEEIKDIKGLLIQIQVYYSTAFKTNKELQAIGDPLNAEYNDKAYQMIQTLSKMNRLIRKIISKKALNTPEVQIHVLIDLMSGFRDIQQKVSKRNTSFMRSLGDIKETAFTMYDELKEVIDSKSLGEKAQTLAKEFVNQYDKMRKVWVALYKVQLQEDLSKKDKQTRFNADIIGFRKALEPLIQSLADLIKQVDDDLKHPNI